MAIVTKFIGIYLFDDVEMLDFAGPYEVMTTATRVYARENPQSTALFSVVTIGRTKARIRVRAGLKVDPDCSVGDHPKLDCLIVPGGVISKEIEKTDVVAWIARQLDIVPLTASVCTGAFLIAKTVALKGYEAITHWEDIADLAAMFPEIRVRRGARWIDNGKVVTSAGISAGIDMSLHLVERLVGRQAAIATARQMEFDWSERGSISHEPTSSRSANFST